VIGDGIVDWAGHWDGWEHRWRQERHDGCGWILRIY
jgi:hypothetical protein